ncbi:MAG: hypothetical protein N3G22_00440 [Candidatus Micrarchaeota archaeon]|nr:hypothetical protein [Candidatus Micrarchaeota archaeon]
MGKTARKERPSFCCGVLRLKDRVPFLLVAITCIIIALRIGILEPEFHYQKALSFGTYEEDGQVVNASFDSFAAYNRLVIPVMNVDGYQVNSSFLGQGKVDQVEIGLSEGELRLDYLEINGVAICAPCNESRYKVDLKIEGELDLFAEIGKKEAEAEKKDDWGKLEGFFRPRRISQATPLLGLYLSPSWKPVYNEKMPSSFYGTDAPAHLDRTAILVDHLKEGAWPVAIYSFASVLPAALMSAVFGITPQYAFKVYAIILFFAPIALFYLFSRKIPAGREAVFVFSSLIYLFIPSSGLLVGGWPDLFKYGMLPRTLATYLTLLFFYFAYEFVFEKKKARFLLAAFVFAAALLCHPKIFFPLLVMLLVLFLAAFLEGRLRKRVVVLAFACLSLSVGYALFVWENLLTLPPAQLGGVSISDWHQPLVALLQVGTLVLPILIILGGYAIWKQKLLFPALLASKALIILAIATSPQANDYFDFLDGLRYFPSFFLPMFFVAGMGMQRLYDYGKRCIASFKKSSKLDDITVLGAVVLLSIPTAIHCAGVFERQALIYRNLADDVGFAIEWEFLEEVRATAKDGYVAFIPYNLVSHYPISSLWPSFIGHQWYVDANSLYENMKERNSKYVILGNNKLSYEPDEKTRYEEYLEIKNDGRFIEIVSSGAGRLFALKDMPSIAPVGYYSEDAKVESYRIWYGKAWLKGRCEKDNCTIFLCNYALLNSKCTNKKGTCEIIKDEKTSLSKISGIGQGEFEITAEPAIGWHVVLLVAFGLVAAAGCYLFLIDEEKVLRSQR